VHAEQCYERLASQKEDRHKGLHVNCPALPERIVQVDSIRPILQLKVHDMGCEVLVTQDKVMHARFSYGMMRNVLEFWQSAHPLPGMPVLSNVSENYPTPNYLDMTK
jgi:hypothetical protein